MYDVKFPIILPRGHPVTKLIVKYYREMANNAAVDFLKNSAAREEIRSWENKCSECRKMKTKLAPLRAIRLSFRPFDQCAVDYAEPFETIQGRGIKRQKRYLCLFTCLQNKKHS